MTEYTIDKRRVKTLESEVRDLFIDKDEKSLAKELIRKYLTDYTIETISDQNTLNQLVYLEILNNRLQRILNDASAPSEDGKAKLYISEKLIESFHKNLREIVNLKDKLGITKTKAQESQKDAFSYLENVRKKYDAWLKDNQGSRYMTCPHCSESILMRIKTDAWEAQKHPFFKDRILGNDRIVKLYIDKVLSKDDIAAIFQVSTDYADWLVSKWLRKVNPKSEVVAENEGGSSDIESNAMQQSVQSAPLQVCVSSEAVAVDKQEPVVEDSSTANLETNNEKS